MRYQVPRGTHDVLPGDVHRWHRLEADFREFVSRYGYEEIRTPMFEDTDLFLRTAGDTSDIVTKQMYSFEDKGGRNITLKPEGTAPAMRALIEHNLCPPGTIARLYYVSPFFRYERPMKGRYRQLHQVGLELVGSKSPLADAEVIEISAKFYESLKIPGVTVLLNSLGRDECRAKYQEAILEFAEPVLRDQGEEMRAKALKNPLRLLDSKDEAMVEAMKSAPSILNFLEEDSKAEFEQLQQLLTDAHVTFEVRPEIVRGLDYYTGTVFEVQSNKLGTANALCGGGRYDKLIKELGGADTPSVGVGMGIERALIVLEEEGLSWPAPRPDAFVAYTGIDTQAQALDTARSMRNSGMSVVVDPEGRSLKAQLRQADKLGARYVVLIGEDEVAKNVVSVRILDTGDQREMALAQLLTLAAEAP